MRVGICCSKEASSAVAYIGNLLELSSAQEGKCSRRVHIESSILPEIHGIITEAVNEKITWREAVP